MSKEIIAAIECSSFEDWLKITKQAQCAKMRITRTAMVRETMDRHGRIISLHLRQGSGRANYAVAFASNVMFFATFSDMSQVTWNSLPSVFEINAYLAKSLEMD